MSTTELEEFVAPQQNKYTEPLLFVPGEYTLSQVGRVPYLSSVMSLRDLVNQIKLVEDIPEEARLDWSLEELFQRDISWDRVETELVNGYLKDANKLTFFNSLTIALLPQKGVEIEGTYGQPESSPTSLYEAWEKIDIGNICIEYGVDRSIGVVRWHKEKVFPVAIDGQHRLAALKRYWEDEKDYLVPETSLELNTKIPLIILILDEEFGFKGRSNNLLVTLREIFIDLNRNARRVPKSRLILLEDLNIQSFCVRTLLANKAKEVSPDVLPLSLVIWQEDEAKFESESKFPYAITSVLNLNEIVGSCLGVKLLDQIDPLDETQVRRHVSQLNAKLELDTEVKTNIQEHLQYCIDRQDPFSFKDSHLTAFKEAFKEQWSPYIIRVFTEFTPYMEYLKEAKQIGAIDGIIADFLLLHGDKQEKFKERKMAEDDNFNPRLEIDEPLEKIRCLKKDECAFYVVFQKALFINLFELEAQKESLELGEASQNRNDFVTWWIDRINKLYQSGMFDLNWKHGQRDLWRGIAKRPDNGNIQYSKAAASRISSFITICIWFIQKSAQQDVDTFTSDLIAEESGMPNIVQTAFKKKAMVRSGLESLVRPGMDPGDLEDEKKMGRKIKAELVKRLKVIQGKIHESNGK